MPFTTEQKVSLLECYYRNGQIQQDGTWIYPMKECIRDYVKQFPETNVAYDTLTQHIRRLVQRFRKTGCICKGKAPGRKTVLTDEAIEHIRLLLEQDPDASWRKLSKSTGLAIATCQKVVKRSSREERKHIVYKRNLRNVNNSIKVEVKEELKEDIKQELKEEVKEELEVMENDIKEEPVS